MNFKKLAVATLLTLVSLSTMAEWVSIGTTKSTTFYYDPVSVKKSGVTVQLLYLVDLDKSPEVAGGKKPYASTTNLAVFDCMNRQTNIVHFTEYSEAMAAGKTQLDMDSKLGWAKVLDGTVDAKIWAVACGGRP